LARLDHLGDVVVSERHGFAAPLTNETGVGLQPIEVLDGIAPAGWACEFEVAMADRPGRHFRSGMAEGVSVNAIEIARLLLGIGR